jgi:hypothetical protein
MRYEPIPAFRFLTEKPLGSYRYRAAFGGRGGAKSWEFVDAAIFHAVTTPKLRVVFLREIMANLKESSLELVRSRLEHYGLLNTYFREVDGTFVGLGGQKIMFIGLWKGNKPEGIKSLEGRGPDDPGGGAGRRGKPRSTCCCRPSCARPSPSCGRSGTRRLQRIRSTSSSAGR